MQTSIPTAPGGSVTVHLSARDIRRSREFLGSEQLRQMAGTSLPRPAARRSIADAPKALSLENIGSMSLYDMAELLPAR